MKKTFSLKSLSAIALFMLLASHSEQIYSQNDSVVIRAGEISAALVNINNQIFDLDKELQKINNGAGNIKDIETIQQNQARLDNQYNFLNMIAKLYFQQNTILNAQADKIGLNVNKSAENVGIVTNNFYMRNLQNDIMLQIFNTVYGAIIAQYPFLEIPLNLILNLKGLK